MLNCRKKGGIPIIFTRHGHINPTEDATSDPALHEATLMNLAYGFTYLHECGELIHYLNALE